MINFLDDKNFYLCNFNYDPIARKSISTNRRFFMWLFFWLLYDRIFKVKKKKKKFRSFFLITTNIMAQSIEALSGKMQEMNLTNEIFYGKDLSSKEKFLKSLTEVVIKHFDEQYQEAFFLKKKSMAFCF